MSKINIKKTTEEEKQQTKIDPRVRKRYDAQLRLAVLGQLFLEAAEDFERFSNLKIIDKSKVTKTIVYCEKQIPNIYNAYYESDPETTMAIMNEYENILNTLKNLGSFGQFVNRSQIIQASLLDKETMLATTHRILKKNNIDFIK